MCGALLKDPYCQVQILLSAKVCLHKERGGIITAYCVKAISYLKTVFRLSSVYHAFERQYPLTAQYYTAISGRIRNSTHLILFNSSLYPDALIIGLSIIAMKPFMIIEVIRGSFLYNPIVCVFTKKYIPPFQQEP